MPKRLRVVVADDSSTYRRLVREVLVEIPYIDLVGAASNGIEALEAARKRKPDLLTLDLEMPFLSGLAVLRRLRDENLTTGAIVVSGVSVQAAAATNQALRLGAFDFIVKPVAESPAASRKLLHDALESRLQAFGRARFGEVWDGPPNTPSPFASLPGTPARTAHIAPTTRPQALGIGVSTGGPAALSRLLPNLPEDLGVPIFIVQHMPPVFTKSLAEDLNRRSRIAVREAEDGEPVAPNAAYIAPGGMQMKVVTDAAKRSISLSKDPPERNCRPSVDYLFRSIADVYHGAALAVVMTGMGDDGAAGCEQLKQQGARVVAQDEASSVVFGMPRRVIELGLADSILPLDQLAEHISSFIRVRSLETTSP